MVRLKIQCRLLYQDESSRYAKGAKAGAVHNGMPCALCSATHTPVRLSGDDQCTHRRHCDLSECCPAPLCQDARLELLELRELDVALSPQFGALARHLRQLGLLRSLKVHWLAREEKNGTVADDHRQQERGTWSRQL